MADDGGGGPDIQAGFLGHKLGPLPVVAWVGLAAGTAAVGLAVRSRMAQSSASSSTAIDTLAPSAAEAFGTLQQQEIDLTNQLAALESGQATSAQGLAQMINGAISAGNANSAESSAGTAFLINPNDPRIAQLKDAEGQWGQQSHDQLEAGQNAINSLGSPR